MFDGPEARQLSGIELRVLRTIKPGSRPEKQISKMLQVDPLLLSPIITDLMLKGYVETIRRRRFYFFRTEYFCITSDGLAALEKSRNSVQNLVDYLRSRALAALESAIARSPVLNAAALSARAIYRITKAAV